MGVAVAIPTAVFVLAAVLMAIPSRGTGGVGLQGAAAQIPTFDPRRLDPEPLFAPWGVSGTAPNVETRRAGCPPAESCADRVGPQPKVWDFAELGDRVYVAGIFTGVRRNEFSWPDEPVRDQPFLAAFDRLTGEFVASFAPRLDGPVYEIVARPDGTLLAGGEFTVANGAPRPGLVALDPATGATLPAFQATLAAPGSPEPASVRELLVDGSDVYVGGAFSQLTDGNDGSDTFVWNVVRLDADTGALDRTWLPRAAGAVWDVALDPARSRVHLVGAFTSVDALPATNQLATVSTATGRAIGGLAPYDLGEQNGAGDDGSVGVAVAGNRTWVVGNRLLGIVDPATNARLRTYDEATFPNPPGTVTGDHKTIETVGGFVLTGHDGTASGTIWAYDASTTNAVAFAPNLSRNSSGTWALHADVDGCLWAGGDHHRTSTGRWLGGFARFCPRERNVAQGRTATASSSEPGSVAARAVDGDTDGNGAAGSVASSTEERQPWWEVDLGASVSIGSIELFNRTDCCAERLTGVWVLTSETPITASTLEEARGQAGVRATNLGGPLGLLGASRRLDTTARYVRVQLAETGVLSLAEVRLWRGRAADARPPTTPTDVAAAPDADGITVTWQPSTGDVGVRGYLVHRNWQFLAWVPKGTTYRDTSLVPGVSYRYEIRAQDAAGNNSPPSTPVTVRGGAPDLEAPATPDGVAAVPGAASGSVVVSWNAATDNVGVRGYLVHRDWAFVAWVPVGTSFTDVNLAPGGTYAYQVRAQDAAGNNSPPSLLTPAVAP